MKYIVWGGGESGRKALLFLGAARVLCFADRKTFGGELFGKRIISLEEMMDTYREREDVFIVIASIRYGGEMEAEIKGKGVLRYFVFRDDDFLRMNDVLPYYDLYRKRMFISYTHILARYDIKEYRNIVIYGMNEFLPYLITEIMVQNPDASIKLVRQENDTEEYYTLGLPIVALREIENEMDCLVLNVKYEQDDIRSKVSEKSVYKIVDLYDADKVEPAFRHEKLSRFKGRHKGERVFLIGNGPSLTVEDLNTLYENKEICIGFNKIYKIYNQTPWRADYLGFTDVNVIGDCSSVLSELPGEVLVADTFHFDDNIYLSDVSYFHMAAAQYYPNHPKFSDDLTYGTYNGKTVIYDIGIQWAAYMGFSEIYLIGVDHCMTGNAAQKENHFIEDYVTAEEAPKYANSFFEGDKLTAAFEKAEQYSRENGFRIYNATRGGKLEVFERVDFDSLFRKK